ncbi:MAG: CehA/McbA family metallohydrolase, partial [Acidobacteria bacterium]|nr:CehA/McbA family metallohydrolase [Acidobacteriota bacterium]
CGWAHEVVEGIDGMEISNGRHGEVEQALAIWDRLLTSGRRIAAVGSSDWHSAATPIDVANVRVYARALTVDGILGAIRRGHVIVMRSARDRTPEIVVRAGAHAARIGESLNVAPGTPMTVEVAAAGLAGARLRVVANGQPATEVVLDAAGRARVEQRAESGYVRFELYAADGMLVAVTNPVYLVSL